MNIKPIGERILLKLIKKEEKTTSGIILTSSSKNDEDVQNIWEVLALGNGEKLKEFSIKVGDKLICNKYAGNAVKKDDDENRCLIVNLEDVLAIVE